MNDFRIRGIVISSRARNLLVVVGKFEREQIRRRTDVPEELQHVSLCNGLTAQLSSPHEGAYKQRAALASRPTFLIIKFDCVGYALRRLMKPSAPTPNILRANRLEGSGTGVRPVYWIEMSSNSTCWSLPDVSFAGR